ncbi:MAG: hypothetical protein P1P85_03160 [Patescibacteria group bacterium]|nr:hypothetical protein [Patescibacteria group bacterium]
MKEELGKNNTEEKSKSNSNDKKDSDEKNIVSQNLTQSSNKNETENITKPSNLNSNSSIGSKIISKEEEKEKSQNKENIKRLIKEKYKVEDIDESDVNDNKEDNSDDESWELRQYTLQDTANNSLVIVLKHKNEGKEAKVKIESIKYNNSPELNIEQNMINAQYSENQDNSIKNLELKILIKNQFDAKAKYMSKTNETEITMKLYKENEKTREIWQGIVILELLTNKGNIMLNY